MGGRQITTRKLITETFKAIRTEAGWKDTRSAGDEKDVNVGAEKETQSFEIDLTFGNCPLFQLKGCGLCWRRGGY